MPDIDSVFRWEDRLCDDHERAGLLQPALLRETVEEVLRRAVDAGALAVALTGSTVRGHRTPISDLDFHLVGTRLDLSGLPADVDLVADSLGRFRRRLAEGDDLVQWTLRFGWILHDPSRLFGDTYARILRTGMWPDPLRKFERADALISLAERVLSIDDRDAGQEHVRAGLTSLARGLLLAEGEFPLSRDELVAQLNEMGCSEAGDWLSRTIHEALDLGELHEALEYLRKEARKSPIRVRKRGTIPRAA